MNLDSKDPNFFDDVVQMMYDNVDKTEELYKEIHENYQQNQPQGFTLGTSRTSVETAKVLSEIRSTSITATKSLFDAKKSVVELEIKKQAQKTEDNRAEADKDFIRAALSEINNNKSKPSLNKVLNARELTGGSSAVSQTIRGALELEQAIDDKVNAGDIKLTANEKAMKYDFKNEVEIVYDPSLESIVPVKKGTNKVLADYPIERANMGKIVRTDNESKKAYTQDGKSVRIANIDS